MLVLLSLSTVGLVGIALILGATYPENFDRTFFIPFLLLGVLGGAGGATFSVGAPQTSYWFSQQRQGWALGVYGGLGNIGAGLFNLAIPLLAAWVSLPGAYGAWAVFMLVATLMYAALAHNPYYFQLREKGVSDVDAKASASQMGQEVFPSGSAWASIKRAARSKSTWVLVLLYMVSFGGGFTALTAWLPTYWYDYQALDIVTAGGLAAAFTVYGSVVRVPGGSLSDRFGGERITWVGFVAMAVGGVIVTFASGVGVALLGMLVLATGMGLANAAIFKLVPVYASGSVGGASGLIGGVGGAGTLVVLPLLGELVDIFGEEGFAYGFVLYAVFGLLCAATAWVLERRRHASSTPQAKVVRS